MKSSSRNKPVRKLKDVRPEVRDFWDGHENRKVFFLGFDDVLENSRDRYFWKCPECNAAMRYPATTVATYGIRCDRCREREAKERRLENEEKKRAAREAKAKREAKSPIPAQAAPTQRTPRGCSETGETAVIGRNIKTGELVRFDTARAAAESIGSRWTSDVTKVCRGVSGHRSAGGFEWRWESEAPAEWFDGAPSARDDERVDPAASERHDDLATSTPTDASSVQPASEPQGGEKSATEERGEGEALAKLDEDAMQLQYATSFSVESATGAGNVWPLVVESVYDWFDYKDRASAKSVVKRRLVDLVDFDVACAWRPDMAISPATAMKLSRTLACALAPYVNDAVIEERSESAEPIVSVPPYIDLQAEEHNVPSSAVVPASFAKGLDAQRDNLRATVEVERADDGSLATWTAKLVELRPEKHDRWLTEVRVDARADGSAFVAVRNATSQDGEDAKRRHVQHSQPKCVANIVKRADLVCRRGGVKLDAAPKQVDLTTPAEFEAFLLEIADTGRTVPLVVVNSNGSGKYPLSDGAVSRLAERLCGVAAVCLVPWTDDGLNNRFKNGLAELTDLRTLAPQRGEINVYLGVHADGEGENAHKLLIVQDRSESKTVQRVMNAVVNRTNARPNVERAAFHATGTTDATEQEEQESAPAVEQDAILAREDKTASSPEGMGANALDIVQMEYNILKECFKNFDEAFMSLKASDLANTVCADSQMAGLMADNRDLERANLELEEQVSEALRNEREAMVKAQHYEQLYSETKSERDAFERKINAMNDLEAIPTNMKEVVNLAKSMFADHLVFAPKAERSAEDDSTGGYCEAWRILRALDHDLWPMCFDRDDRPAARIADDFKLRTGFELTLSESSNTKASQRCRTQRTIRYNNKTLSIEPHVKGTSGSKSNRLRVYFAIDRDERKIVIGHCGNHLETIGTKRKELQ